MHGTTSLKFQSQIMYGDIVHFVEVVLYNYQLIQGHE